MTGRILKGVCAGKGASCVPSKPGVRGRGRPPKARSPPAPTAAHPLRSAAPQGGILSASSPSRRKISRLETEVENLKSELDLTKAKLVEKDADCKRNKSLHGDAVLKLHAEDMMWRKRYRTLVKHHERLGKHASSNQNNDLLQVLAEAALWDKDAAAAEESDRAAATVAAAAKLAAEKDLEEAKAMVQEASEAFQAAKQSEAAAKELEAAAKQAEAAARQTKAAAQQTEAAARQTQAAARQSEAAAKQSEVAAKQALQEAETKEATAVGAMKDAKQSEAAAIRLAAIAVRAKEQQKPPGPTTTKATVGTKSFSQWRTRTRQKIIEFFISLFGVDWHRKYHSDITSAADVEDPYAGKSTDPAHVVEALDSFFKIYQELFDVVGEPTRRRGHNIAALAEGKANDAIQEHLDKVVLALYTQCSLTEHGYQCLINYTSNFYNEGGVMQRIKLPFGTPLAKWMPKNKLIDLKKEVTEKLGIEIKYGSAWLDPKEVLIKRVVELVKKGLIKLDGTTITLKVQILGDATTVWRSMRVNGTTIVLKVIYDDKTEGKKVEGDGVNTVQNQRALGFYLGDDTQKELKLSAPDLPKQLMALVQDGIVVDDTRINVELLLGGDMKFLNSMIGILNNASHFPCPFCLVHKSLLGATLEQLEAAKAKYEQNLPALKQKHLTAMVAAGRNARGRGPAKKTTKKGKDGSQDHIPMTYLGPRTNAMQQQLGHVTACSECPGHVCWQATSTATQAEIEAMSDAVKEFHHQSHFSTPIGGSPFFDCIPLYNVIIDVLHVVLRVVPAIYRATVSAHVDTAECQSIAQWIFDVHRVVVSGSTSVQSATGNQAAIGTECWPGAVCQKLMLIYPEVLDMVHDKETTLGKENLDNAEDAWDSFFTFNEKLVEGCNDDDPEDVKKHSEELRLLAEDFVNKFKKTASTTKVPPYMHAMTCDIPRMVLRHGSLTKYSSQGVERLHQWVKFITGYRSSRQHAVVAATVMRGITNKASVEVEMPGRRKRGRETLAGGHMSKADRQDKIQRTDALKDAISLKKEAPGTSDDA